MVGCEGAAAGGQNVTAFVTYDIRLATAARTRALQPSRPARPDRPPPSRIQRAEW
ncbi:MAG TPA: hypothetical protein VFO16_22810 [Pseudonocardiaceae bacterium]|nr:hypothetical protein [Pseudonocardiaceae bacterium]